MGAMDWVFVSSPNPYVEAQTLRWLYLERGASKEVIKVMWGHKGGALIW